MNSPEFSNATTVEPGTLAPKDRDTDWSNRYFAAKLNNEGLATKSKALGTGLDLPAEKEWADLQGRGVHIGAVTADMGKDAADKQIDPFKVGFNDPKHATLVREKIIHTLEAASKARIRHMIVFTGMDTGEDRQVQFDRIVRAYTEKPAGGGESLMEIAERCGVTMDMEMLNTKGDPNTWRGHPGYLGNSTDEVADLVRKIRELSRSDNIGLLFDLYHVAMMGENIHDKIDSNCDVITYIHTAGMQQNEDGTPAANTRGPLTAPNQIIDFPRHIARLEELCPNAPRLLELLSEKTTLEEVTEETRASFQLCLSGIRKAA